MILLIPPYTFEVICSSLSKYYKVYLWASWFCAVQVQSCVISFTKLLLTYMNYELVLPLFLFLLLMNFFVYCLYLVSGTVVWTVESRQFFWYDWKMLQQILFKEKVRRSLWITDHRRLCFIIVSRLYLDRRKLPPFGQLKTEN